MYFKKTILRCPKLHVWLVVFLFQSLLLTARFAQGPTIQNGGFDDWVDDTPAHWKVADGAGNPSGNPSSIKPGEGGVVLSGDDSTRSWKMLSQSLDIKPGKTYEIKFTAKSADVQFGKSRFNNCFVGVISNDNTQRLGLNTFTVMSKEFATESLCLYVPQNAKSNDLILFLSQPGSLAIKDIQIASLDPKQSFDVLVADMDRNYSYFKHKNIDWKKLTELYRERAEAQLEDPDQFSKIIYEMLGELNDVHVHVRNSSKRLYYPSSYDLNADVSTIMDV